MKINDFVVAAFLSWWLLVESVHAELPPRVYDDWKYAAQEVLHIRVINMKPTRVVSLDKRGCISEKWFEIHSEVLRTIRTISTDEGDGIAKTGRTRMHPIKTGDKVIFESYIRVDDEKEGCQGWVGPSWPITLQEQNCYLAYLNRSESDDPLLELAAGGHSFESITCPGSCSDDEQGES